jgi:hypothetical protein
MGAPPAGAPMGAPPAGAPMGAPPAGAPMGAPPAAGLAGAPTAAPPIEAKRSAYGPVKGVSTVLYLIMTIGMLVIGVGLTVLGVANMRKMHELLFFSWIPIIPAAVFYYILLYKAWAALDDGSTKPSPGAALGLMFVPFFNIYWIFIAIGSYGSRFNELADRQGLKPRMGEGAFIAAAILMFVFGPVGLFLAVLKWCEAINKLAKATKA